MILYYIIYYVMGGWRPLIAILDHDSQTRYPKHDGNFSSKLYLRQEQNNIRSCCQWGLRVIFSGTAVRHVTTPLKGTHIGRNFGSCFL